MRPEHAMALEGFQGDSEQPARCLSGAKDRPQLGSYCFFACLPVGAFG